VPACDRRTDGRTDGRPAYISITCFSIADTRKKNLCINFHEIPEWTGLGTRSNRLDFADDWDVIHRRYRLVGLFWMFHAYRFSVLVTFSLFLVSGSDIVQLTNRTTLQIPSILAMPDSEDFRRQLKTHYYPVRRSFSAVCLSTE